MMAFDAGGSDANGQVAQSTLAVKSWEVVYLPSAETVRLTPGQGPSRA